MAFDITSAATTATSTVKNAINNSGVVSGLQSAGASLDKLKTAATSGVTNLAGSLTNAIPGQLKSAIEAIPKIADLNIESLLQAAKSVVSVSGTPPFANVLHNFASYNYLWTLSVLSPQDLNFPDDSYRKGKLGPIILQSGSGNPNDRISTIFRSTDNPAGKFDYYMENVRISGMIGMDKTTGNTNATGITFDIVEPYSMGLFFQSLQIAALEANYANYLDCPLLLRLEFKGHLDQYKQNVQIPGTTKYLPLKIRNITMRVSGNGSVYTCEAIPWNEKAHNTTYSQIKTEITVSGSTVQQMIQTGEKSLQKVVNDRYQESVKRKDVEVPDQIIILFPTDLKTSDASTSVDDSSSPATATSNPNQKAANSSVFNRLGVARSSDGFNLVQKDNINPIGISSMGFNEYRKGDPAFGKDNAVYDEKTGTYQRGNITISKTSSEARFNQGTDIPNVINQVILSSDYGRQALDPDKIDSDGFINWWRIDTQVYMLDTDANIGKTGRKPNLVVYRVTPHKIHHSKFMAPNSAAKGTESLKLQALKEYNYLYTSKNLDIINFNIEFNAAFYTALTADSGKNNQGVVRASETGRAAADTAAPNDTVSGRTEGAGNGQGAIELGTVPTIAENDKIKTRSGGKGGAGSDDPGTMAARQFHDAITEGSDMVQLDMEIMGDPFFLGDSGMGNYSAQATNLKGLNSDGGINYQDGEVYINVKFRNPVDISRSTGRYDFPNGKLVPQFSGLYRVTKVENNFKTGKFTQTLSLTRMVGQDVKDDGSAGKTLVSKIADTFNPNNPDSYATGPNGEGLV
jgi:hypothetical protein